MALPPSLDGVHNVFHVSMLRKCMHMPSHVIHYESPYVREDLTYEEQPVQILDMKEKVLRNKAISLVKVLWRNHAVEEREEEVCDKFPDLFVEVNRLISRTIFLKGRKM